MVSYNEIKERDQRRENLKHLFYICVLILAVTFLLMSPWLGE